MHADLGAFPGVRALVVLFLASEACDASPPVATASRATSASAMARASASVTAAPVAPSASVAPIDDWENLPIPEPVAGSCNVEAALLDGAWNVVRQNEKGHHMSMPIDEPRAWLRRTLASLPSSDEARAIVAEAANDAVRAIARRDFRALAAMVDPNTGVCLRAAFTRSCRWMKADELAQCGTDRTIESWDVDTGSTEWSATHFTCREAFDQLFTVRPIDRAVIAYNCFPANAGRSNCGGGYVDLDAEGDLYVEYHLPDKRDPDGQGWQSVWLTFQSTPRGPMLRALMSEYWGI